MKRQQHEGQRRRTRPLMMMNASMTFDDACLAWVGQGRLGFAGTPASGGARGACGGREA